jgi:probable HAF family extracellular repeat protein
MTSRVFAALLGALFFGLSAIGVAAAPQYQLIDLGATDFAGAVLPWAIPAYELTPPNWPSSGGTSCTGGSAAGYVWARYAHPDYVVGGVCDAVGGEEAAKWILSGNTVTLVNIGRLPGALTDQYGPFSVAYGYNTVGDIVGQSQSTSLSYDQNCPSCVALHGFIYNNGAWTDLVPIAGPSRESLAQAVNDSHEVVGWTNTVANTTGVLLTRAFVYTGGTMYNLTFYLVGGPTALLTKAYAIDCQGNIAALGTPAAGGTTHNYLLVRQGAARTSCPQ